MKISRLQSYSRSVIALALMSLCVCGFMGNQEESSAAKLLEQFKSTQIFWQQFEIAKKIVAFRDTSVLQGFDGWLNHDDRHLRGNAAFIFASLGDDRGFNVIREILRDRSDRPPGQGIAVASPDGRYHVDRQIEADRYYAAHLFGDLKDPRAVPIRIPLLSDDEVNHIVPWALGEIGDKRADVPLIEALGNNNPSIRVLAIYALEKLGAKEALPRLHELLSDNERSTFDGLVSVAEAAKAAIAKFETKP
jgi:HEAT repeat protein